MVRRRRPAATDLLLPEARREIPGFSRRFSIIFETGEQLARLTDFDRIENGVLYVKAKGSAASNLVVLRKRSIIYAFNRMFPEDKVSSIKVEVVY